MEILLYLLGLSTGVFIMCITQINKLKDIQSEVSENYIPKYIIVDRINQLKNFNKKIKSDLKIYNQNEEIEYAINQLKLVLGSDKNV